MVAFITHILVPRYYPSAGESHHTGWKLLLWFLFFTPLCTPCQLPFNWWQPVCRQKAVTYISFSRISTLCNCHQGFLRQCTSVFPYFHLFKYSSSKMFFLSLQFLFIYKKYISVLSCFVHYSHVLIITLLIQKHLWGEGSWLFF